MRDRTEEFNQKVSEKVSPIRFSTEDEEYARQTFLENKSALFVKDFLNKVEEINEMFSNLDQKIEDVLNVHTALLEFSETDERLFVYYESIKKNFIKISGKISDLEKSFDATKFFGSDTELRICTTQLLTLKKKLTSSVSDYYKIQEEYKEKCKARVKRQAMISGADISKLDFDAAIGSKTEFFLHAVFPDYNIAHYYMNEIKKRHEDFLRLENSILQLRDLIFEMNIILTADAALINRIDKHSQAVEAYVTRGASDTKEYKRATKSRRLKYYICFGCIAVFAVLVVLAFITSFS